eukprot:3169460-Amphidinium_carterae.1
MAADGNCMACPDSSKGTHVSPSIDMPHVVEKVVLVSVVVVELVTVVLVVIVVSKCSGAEEHVLCPWGLKTGEIFMQS